MARGKSVRTLNDDAVIWKEPSAAQKAANVDLYDIAYAEAQAGLESQNEEVNNMRTRAVSFLAFVASATAFLAGVGVHVDAAQKHGGFYWLAGSATAASLATLCLVGWLLSPWTTKLYRHIDTTLLLEKIIERDVPPPSKGEMLRELALRLNTWQNSNLSAITRVRLLYQLVVLVGGLQLILWVGLVWLIG